MDFFLSVCPGNLWQVGHFGISDRNHKYYVLCFIIAKSENHEAAGKLIERACKLAPIDKVLVDGGGALAKAIGIKDQMNINALKEALPKEAQQIIDRELDPKHGFDNDSPRPEVEMKELKSDEEAPFLCPLGSADVPSSSGEAGLASFLRQVADDPSPTGEEAAEALEPVEQPEVPSESVLDNTSQDILFEELVVDILDATNDDAGDLSWEDRIKVLLRKHRLLLERCHAHITRNAGSRGGGWRGGKGSLCRALLNNGCKQTMMKTVRHRFFNLLCCSL